MIDDQVYLKRWVETKDEAAFAALVERYEPLIRNCAFRCLGSVPEVDDVTQASFLIFSQKAEKLHANKPLATWFHTVTTRLAWRASKIKQRDQNHESMNDKMRNDEHFLDSVIKAELRQQLDKAISSLPNKQREAIILSYFQGITHPEIASSMNIPIGSVSRHLKKGLEKLQKILKKSTGYTITLGLLESLGAEETNLPTPLSTEKSKNIYTCANDKVKQLANSQYINQSLQISAHYALMASLIIFIGILNYFIFSHDSYTPKKVIPDTGIRKQIPKVSSVKAHPEPLSLSDLRISFNFENSSFKEVTKFFEETVGIPVKSQLSLEQIENLDPITLQVTSMTIRPVLAWLSQPYGIEMNIEDNKYITLKKTNYKKKTKSNNIQKMNHRNDPFIRVKNQNPTGILKELLANNMGAARIDEPWKLTSRKSNEPVSLRLYPDETHKGYSWEVSIRSVFAAASSHTKPSLRDGYNFHFSNKPLPMVLKIISNKTKVPINLESGRVFPKFNFSNKNIAADRLLEQICKLCGLGITENVHGEVILRDISDPGNTKEDFMDKTSTLNLTTSIKDKRIDVNFTESSPEELADQLEDKLGIPVHLDKTSSIGQPNKVLLSLKDYEFNYVAELINSIPGYDLKFTDDHITLKIQNFVNQ